MNEFDQMDSILDTSGTNTIRKNKNVFFQYSKLRKENAYTINREKSAVAFEIVPALLSLNDPSLPGFVPKGEESCGVYGIGTSKKLHETIRNYFPEIKNHNIRYQRFIIQQPIIESLFLMGSIGTVAQTETSDFDFWVCVDEQRLAASSMKKLHTKTEIISKWCQHRFDMEVHFFIMTQEQIRHNDFGQIDEESAGSSQKNFLKEEFYRTLLLVSGKVPFWWIVPSGISRELYHSYWRQWSGKDLYDVDEFLDLGFLGDVPQEELLGSTLWYLSKGIKDPFKALIKMTMMEWYLSEYFDGRLLCDVLKERVIEGNHPLSDLDPYLLMVEKVLDFYARTKKQNHVELLRKAFYIKADPKITRLKLKSKKNDYQVDVFNRLMKDWEWSLEKVENLNQISHWSYARHLKLAKEFNKYFFSTYKRLRSTFDLNKERKINDRDLILMGRKLTGLFAKSKDKLHITPFLTKKRLTLERCIFRFNNGENQNSRWFIYDATPYPFEKENKTFLLYSAARITEAAAWLVINNLFDIHKTHINMPPNSSRVNINDLIDLLRHLQNFFSPDIYQVKIGDVFQTEAKQDKMMIVSDMTSGVDMVEPKSLDLIFNNTWGEIFVETYEFREGLEMIQKYVVNQGIKHSQELTEKIRVHVPRSLWAISLRKKIDQVILHGLG